jgi:putative serine protease PepD
LAYDVERQDPTNSDIIVAVDGQAVDTASAFVEKIEDHQPGEQLRLTILRQGQQIEVPVTLGSN